ncbi:hypothetical protein AB3N59_01720 [Leptospira sp. WS92.C1]
MLKKIILSLSFLFFQACSTFLIGDHPNLPSAIPEINKEVTYELIGWKEGVSKKYASEILRTIHLSGTFKKISQHTKYDSEIKIQIILEKAPRLSLLFGEQSQPVTWGLEKEPGKFSLYILNRILTYRTFFIVPILQKSSDRVVFRVWKWNQKVAEYSYTIRNVQAIGWVSLGLLFFDDRDKIEDLYSNYAKQFLSDSQSVY